MKRPFKFLLLVDQRDKTVIDGSPIQKLMRNDRYLKNAPVEGENSELTVAESNRIMSHSIRWMGS